MKKVILFDHVSLDGFVAGPNGELDWVLIDNQMFDFVNKRTSKTNTALYGRVTWQMMDNYWPTAGKNPKASKHDIEHGEWYNKIDKIVLSKTIKSDPSKKVRVIGNDLVNEVNEIRNGSDGEILVFGSPRASHALEQNNLVDGMWLFVNPILLGKGISLFSGIKDQTKFKLDNTHTFDNGVVCLSYSKK